MHGPDCSPAPVKKLRRDESSSVTPRFESRFLSTRRDAVLLRQRRERMRRRRLVRRREYQRLRTMVPSIATKPLVSKVTVIEEAIRYIDYLHDALLARLKTKGLPQCLQGVNIDVNQLNPEGIKDLVCQLVEKTSSSPGASQIPTPSVQSSSAPRPSHRDQVPTASSGVLMERIRQLPSYLNPKRQSRKRS